MKYSFEIKLKAVKAIKKGILIKEPYNKICRQWRDRVKHWKKIYDKHGEDGLKRQYRKHTYKEKLKAVKEVINGNSINQVSINRNIPNQSIYYQNELKKRNIRQSFSRKGNCIDNSIMENFFGIMKKEMFYGYEKDFKTLEELKIAMIKYINYYNNKRINKKRKGLSPLEHRQQYFSLINKN